MKLIKPSTNLPTLQLMDNLTAINSTIQDVKKYVDAIGPNIMYLWNKEKQESSGLVEEAHREGLAVYGWTFQDDLLTIGSEWLEQYELAYETLHLDGVITEFAFSAVSAVKELQKHSKFESKIENDFE